MQQTKSKNYSLANRQKRQSESHNSFNVRFILAFYWGLFILSGAVSTYLVYTGEAQSPADVLWTYLPRSIWMVTLAVIFFDSLNISVLQSTPFYVRIGKEAHKKDLMPDIIQMNILSGGLLLISILLTLHGSNYNQNGIFCCLGSIAIGWFLIDLLRLFRFR